MPAPSGTPLQNKLGFKPGSRVHLDGAPDGYLDLFPSRLDDVALVENPDEGALDAVHLFLKETAGLRPALAFYRTRIAPDGMVWVSWPKRASGVPSDVDGDAIRAAAFPLGFVDVKVCAVDATWSAQKLVIRKHLR